MASTSISAPSTCAPILKWAGGKRQLLPEIYAKFPEKFNKFIEPFAGGAAVFFGKQFESPIINDLNSELITTYRAIEADPQAVIDDLEKHSNTEEYFYATRARDWTELPHHEVASRMIYLNRTCFNGLYRVNKKGQFNVPYGRYKSPKIVDPEKVFAVANKLKNATITNFTYQKTLEMFAAPGDVVFLDPPYFAVGKYSDFNRYNANKFGDSDQEELAELCTKLSESGVHIILTNSNHPRVHQLYRNFEINVLETRRNISSKSSTRSGQDVLINSRI
ncbi:DNA adenine methylase [Glutamicibacter arilaitensis]|uniref:site-specific DNA-methyltransferase (adenine-specific) n=1 Tax=Glutamicibacter arilaitensis TaxID=256701 RepID=A0A2N7S6X3_9MICC|nr:DNA adenine methylase [Glutamicibacter arilaitensis]PMQ21888.1 hypothetical protein CIK84_10350 [Glutamicibacter arilaitensis]